MKILFYAIFINFFADYYLCKQLILILAFIYSLDLWFEVSLIVKFHSFFFLLLLKSFLSRSNKFVLPILFGPCGTNIDKRLVPSCMVSII